jgi:hypothetical protein
LKRREAGDVEEEDEEEDEDEEEGWRERTATAVSSQEVSMARVMRERACRGTKVLWVAWGRLTLCRVMERSPHGECRLIETGTGRRVPLERNVGGKLGLVMLPSHEVRTY